MIFFEQKWLPFVASWAIRSKFRNALQDHPNYVLGEYDWNLYNIEDARYHTEIWAHILDPAEVAAASNVSKTHRSHTTYET